MDQVYEHAEATIVAMSGDDRSGLPGVAGRPREQPHFRTARGCLISSCPSIAIVFKSGNEQYEVRHTRRLDSPGDADFSRYIKSVWFVVRLPKATWFLRKHEIVGSLH